MVKPIFVGDYEPGDTRQYGHTEQSGGTTYLPHVVTSPTRSPQSQYACEYTCGGTQYRCENTPSYNGQLLATEGQEFYYGWSVYYPVGFPALTWQICGQWHQPAYAGTDPWNLASPPLAVYVASTTGVDSTHWVLANNGSNPLANGGWQIDLGVMDRGVWYDVTTHLVWSQTAANCLVEIWVNGVLKGSIIPNVPLIYPTQVPAERGSYPKIGYYRNSVETVVSTVIFDNVKIGGTYASVQPDGPPVSVGVSNLSPRRMR